MFKLAKYYVLMQWYQKSRKNLTAILLSVILLVITSFIFSDLIAMTNDKASLVILKWMVLSGLLAVMTYNIVQVFKAVRIPFQKEHHPETVDLRKEEIVQKEHLVSRSELILNKYNRKISEIQKGK